MLALRAKVLRLIRRHGNQTVVAERLGVSQNTVSQIARGLPVAWGMKIGETVIRRSAGEVREERITDDDFGEWGRWLADTAASAERDMDPGAPPCPLARAGRGGKGGGGT